MISRLCITIANVKNATAHLRNSILQDDADGIRREEGGSLSAAAIRIGMSGVDPVVLKLLNRKVDKDDFTKTLGQKASQKEVEMA